MMKYFPGKRLVRRLNSVSAFVSGLALLLIFTTEHRNSMQPRYTLLCLGDSYTIGESVSPSENFPSQVIQLLKKTGYQFDNPEIVAQTGWTTDELQDAIRRYHFRNSYDFVTLLIGVNNQYRGLTARDYKPGFESLLETAIQFAKGKTEHVIVLSIPDWGVTPFAKNAGRDKQEIARDIDLYNAVNREIAKRYKVGYIDITPSTREALNDATLIAPDGLHPSATEYSKWAERVWTLIKTRLNQE